MLLLTAQHAAARHVPPAAAERLRGGSGAVGWWWAVEKAVVMGWTGVAGGVQPAVAVDLREAERGREAKQPVA